MGLHWSDPDLGGLVLGLSTPSPALFSFVLYLVYPFKLCPALLFVTVGLLLASDLFYSAVFSRYAVQHRTTLCVSADLSCWTVLV